MLCADAYFSLTDDCTVTAKHWGRIGSKRVKIDLRSASGLNNWAATMSLSQAQALAAELERQKYRDIRPVADYQGVLRFLFAIYG